MLVHQRVFQHHGAYGDGMLQQRPVVSTESEAKLAHTQMAMTMSRFSGHADQEAIKIGGTDSIEKKAYLFRPTFQGISLQNMALYLYGTLT